MEISRCYLCLIYTCGNECVDEFSVSELFNINCCEKCQRVGDV